VFFYAIPTFGRRQIPRRPVLLRALCTVVETVKHFGEPEKCFIFRRGHQPVISTLLNINQSTEKGRERKDILGGRVGGVIRHWIEKRVYHKDRLSSTMNCPIMHAVIGSPNCGFIRHVVGGWC
jgi:hypothetical protein